MPQIPRFFLFFLTILGLIGLETKFWKPGVNSVHE